MADCLHARVIALQRRRKALWGIGEVAVSIILQITISEGNPIFCIGYGNRPTEFSLVALYAFEFIIGKTGDTSSSTQIGGSVTDIKLPGAAPITNLATQFKYNTGLPNF